jgi:hypothetical protein
MSTPLRWWLRFFPQNLDVGHYRLQFLVADLDCVAVLVERTKVIDNDGVGGESFWRRQLLPRWAFGPPYVDFNGMGFG